MTEKNIDFEHIDFTNVTQQQQDEHKIYFYIKQNSKKISIETEFIYQEFSGIEIKNKYQNEYISYSNNYDKISNIIVILDDKQEVCKNLKKILSFYDDKLNSSKENILGRFGKLHLVQDTICLSKSSSSKEYCIFNLDIGWNYYLKKTGELLSLENSQIIKNKTIKFYSENKDKTKEDKKELIKSLEFELDFIENNNKVSKNVLMSEILNKKDRIDTEVYIRKSQNILNEKKPNECNEEELLMFYGKPEKIDIRTLGKLMKIYNNNSYVKFHCDILNGYINKNVIGDEKKRKIGLQYIIRAIEIINNDTQYDDIDSNINANANTNTNTNTNSNKYNKYNDIYNDINNDTNDTIIKKPVYLFGKKK
jgi:hypothetical protein